MLNYIKLEKRKKMTEWKFIAYCQLFGIARTSYQLRLGRLGGNWTIQLAKDYTIIKQQMFSDPELKGKQMHPLRKNEEDEYFPEIDLLIGWVINSILLPNISEYHIANTVREIVKEAQKNYAEHKKDRSTAGKEERNSVKLEHVDEKEIHRPVSRGHVVEEDESRDPKTLLERINALEKENAQLRLDKKTLQDEIDRLRKDSMR